MLFDKKEDFQKVYDKFQPKIFAYLTRLLGADLAEAHFYMNGARNGKKLYESNCSSCHDLIKPSEHTFDFWSEHICNGDKKLSNAAVQQILVYLKSRSKE